MKIFSQASEIHQTLSELHAKGQRSGFVPTMGALHAGHLGLVKQAARENDVTVVSIFVNPLQFNNPEDFAKYPSQVEEDCRKLEEIGCDMVFIPSVAEIYPDNSRRDFDLGRLDEIMEGKFRPGHFQGVANVIYRFFEILQPVNTYFGLKDYQQFQVVKKITARFFPDIKVIGVPTVREASGLAMSSRNLRLSPEQQALATHVPILMMRIGKMIPFMPPKAIKAWFAGQMTMLPQLTPEYFEIADAETLEPVTEFTPGRPAHAFVAFYCNGVRLIDNMMIFDGNLSSQ